jgi:hypothetical protein
MHKMLSGVGDGGAEMSKPLDPPLKPTKHGPHVGKDQAPLISPINGLHLVYRYTVPAFHQEQL